ncbi:MAG: YncE family protein [Betaproteobacteria bacterium]|nr:YncE family protein [Betaproteobacteria bacterium]
MAFRHLIARLASALVVAAVVLLRGGASVAGQGYGDVLRYLFVPSADRPVVTVIDTTRDRIAGSIDVALVPRQIESSAELAKLVVADGRTPRIALIDLPSARVDRILALDFAPTRLAVSGDGLKLVAADPAAGRVAFVDLLFGKVVAGSRELPPLRDLLFNADGSRLYAAPEGRDGISVIDASTGRIVGEVSAPPSELGGVVSLTRSPNGRTVFARSAGAPLVSVIDIRGERISATFGVPAGAQKVFPSATGAHLLVPDNVTRTVTVVPAAAPGSGIALKGAGDMYTVFSGWFDTVALVPSRAERKVLVYDLDRLRRDADIDLPGTPGRGATTADGKKLYLPLADAGSVAVIDMAARRLVATVRVPGAPATVLMALTFGICH